MGNVVELFGKVVETRLIYDDGNYAMGLGQNSEKEDVLVVVKKGLIDSPVYYNLTEEFSGLAPIPKE